MNTKPICSFIVVFIVTIFSLYLTNAIKEIPCEKDMISIFGSNFIHTDIFHLVSNLFGIYALSRVEEKMGSKKFLLLLIFLLIFNTLCEIVLHRLIKTPCSIGFSGILYGIATFELISSEKIDKTMLIAIILNIAVSPIFNKKSSLSGHITGAVVGIFGGVIYKKLGYTL